MKTKTISLIILIIGIVYMAIDGWLISWWYVPDFREVGPSFISDSSIYSSRTFFIFWAMSVPLGSIITVLGLALYVRMEKLRVLIFIVCSLILLLWLGLWSQSILYPAMYGIGGGLILLSFCVSVLSLTKIRLNATGITKLVLDFRAAGYIFLLITAWGTCGLLGVPSFGLRPEQLVEHDTHGALITMGTKVLICFTLGWIFFALSQYYEYRGNNKTA